MPASLTLQTCVQRISRCLAFLLKKPWFDTYEFFSNAGSEREAVELSIRLARCRRSRSRGRTANPPMPPRFVLTSEPQRKGNSRDLRSPLCHRLRTLRDKQAAAGHPPNA